MSRPEDDFPRLSAELEDLDEESERELLLANVDVVCDCRAADSRAMGVRVADDAHDDNCATRTAVGWDVDLDEDHFACTDPDCTCHDLDDLVLAEPPWTTLIPNARYL